MEKKSISKREKVLLVFLAFLSLTVGGVVYLILPMYQNLEDARDELTRLENEQIHQTMLLASEAGIRAANEAAHASFYEVTEYFLLETHAGEIGRMMIALANRHNLTSLDQRLFEPVISGDIVTVEVTMSLQGSYADLQRLLDAVENTAYLRISRLAFNISSDNPSWLNNISINIEVAMIR